MAFKSAKQFNEEKYSGVFRLVNDGDTADVVFLYESYNDVLIADVHYIKTAEYSGYVHCQGKGCPACQKGIHVQTKLFIPMYNITEDEIQFFDRSARFEVQLQRDVFDKYPNPSDFVFRITRHGEANSVDTSYEITAIAKNTSFPFQKIVTDNKITFPAVYEKICRDVPSAEMREMFNDAGKGLEEYEAVPRRTLDIPPETTSTDSDDEVTF